mmetsp:Transcript_592/g.1742  ORF Transcript_592/g.1742 Transcript_592/m.1742 type:complete len:410 (+) Transcript_592:472-1701(+)
MFLWVVLVLGVGHDPLPRLLHSTILVRRALGVHLVRVEAVVASGRGRDVRGRTGPLCRRRHGVMARVGRDTVPRNAVVPGRRLAFVVVREPRSALVTHLVKCCRGRQVGPAVDRIAAAGRRTAADATSTATSALQSVGSEVAVLIVQEVAPLRDSQLVRLGVERERRLDFRVEGANVPRLGFVRDLGLPPSPEHVVASLELTLRHPPVEAARLVEEAQRLQRLQRVPAVRGDLRSQRVGRRARVVALRRRPRLALLGRRDIRRLGGLWEHAHGPRRVLDPCLVRVLDALAPGVALRGSRRHAGRVRVGTRAMRRTVGAGPDFWTAVLSMEFRIHPTQRRPFGTRRRSVVLARRETRPLCELSCAVALRLVAARPITRGGPRPSRRHGLWRGARLLLSLRHHATHDAIGA